MKLPAGIKLEDPRPIAAAAPYTFEMPWPEELAHLGQGDHAKAVFLGTGADGKQSAERMWVLIHRKEDGYLIGQLDNDPLDLPAIKCGDHLRLPLTHVISCDFREGKQRPTVPKRRSYRDRCFVDACVVGGRSHADFLYREEPDMAREGDKYPDSGWRVRGTDDAISEDERLGYEPLYIALGKVLNQDDRWLHLIDSEVGRAFQWDAASGDYNEVV